MTKFSVKDFKDYCSKSSISNFIIDSENQKCLDFAPDVKTKLVFHNIKIFFNPNTIHFSSDENLMSFYRVKHITRCKTTVIGDIFKITCGDYGNKLNDSEYTVIVS